MAEVRLTRDAAEQLERLNEPIHTRLLRILERLEEWPDVSGAKPLRGKMAGKYRIRTGDYRLIFRTEEKSLAVLIVVEQIGHRRDVYEE